MAKKRKTRQEELPFDAFNEDGKLDGISYRKKYDDILREDFFHHLLNWQIALNIMSPQGMLDYLGLTSDQVTAEQWNDMLAGKAVSPPCLLHYLTDAYKQSGIPHIDPEINHVNSFYQSGRQAYLSAEKGFYNEFGHIPYILTDIPPRTTPAIAINDAIMTDEGEILDDDTIRDLRKNYRILLKNKLAAALPDQDFKLLIKNMAQQLNVNPLALLGYIPVRSAKEILKISDCLEEILFSPASSSKDEIDLFKKMTKQGFGHPVHDISDAIQGDIGFSYGNLLEAFMSRRDVNEIALSSLLRQEKQINRSPLAISSWIRDRSMPSSIDVREALGEVLKINSTESQIWESTYAKECFDYTLAARLAREQKGAQRDLIKDGTVKKLTQQLDRLISKKDLEKKIIFGAQNETLRESQQETVQNLSAHLKKETLTGYAVLPGGGGKTRIAAFVGDASQRADLRSLIIVPNLAAGERVYKEYKTTCPHIKIGRIYGGHNEYDGDVTIIGYQALISQFYRSLVARHEGKEHPFNPRNYQVVVADEAHAYLTQLADHIFENMDAIKIALTATDKYHEGKEVAHRFPGLINRVSLNKAIKRHECARPITRIIQTNFHVNHGIYEKLDLAGDELDTPLFAKTFNVDAWNNLFPQLWGDKSQHIFGEKTFVHCADIGHAEAMAASFNRTYKISDIQKSPEKCKILQEKGIDPQNIEQIAAAIHSDMSQHEQNVILEKFRDKKILVLTSARKLIESVDEPDLKVVMNAVLTNSVVRALQRGYRGSRRTNSKDSWYQYEVLPADWFKYGYMPVLFENYADAFRPSNVEKTVNKENKTIRKLLEPTGEEVITGYKLIWEQAEVEDLLNFIKGKRESSRLAHVIRARNRGQHPFANILERYISDGGTTLGGYFKLCTHPLNGGPDGEKEMADLCSVPLKYVKRILNKESAIIEPDQTERYVAGLQLGKSNELFTKSEAEFWWLARGDKSIKSVDALMYKANEDLLEGKDRIEVSNHLLEKLFLRSGLLRDKAISLLKGTDIVRTFYAHPGETDFQRSINVKIVDKLAGIFAPGDRDAMYSLSNLLLGFPMGTTIHSLLDDARDGRLSLGKLLLGLRLLKRQTIADLESSVNVSRKTMEDWEKEKVLRPVRPTEVWESFAKHFGYSDFRDVQDFIAIANGTYCTPAMKLIDDLKAGKITSRSEFLQRYRAEVKQPPVTTAEFAALCGIPEATYQGIESNSNDRVPLADNAVKIAAGLGYDKHSALFPDIYTLIRFNKTLQGMQQQTAELVEAVKEGKIKSKAVLLRRYREEVRKMMQIEFGEELGLTDQAIRDWENDITPKFPTSENAQKIIRHMGMDDSPDRNEILSFIRSNTLWSQRKTFAESQLVEIGTHNIDTRTVIDRFSESFSLSYAEIAAGINMSFDRFKYEFLNRQGRPYRHTAKSLGKFLGFEDHAISTFADFVLKQEYQHHERRRS